MVDECDFFSLIVASERVARWLDAIRNYLAGVDASEPRLKAAVHELTAALSSEAYAEEARREGAVPLLTSLLKRTGDPVLTGMVAEAIAACCSNAAAKVQTFHYGGMPVVLKEGALGDGVGAKIWTVAHTFCREMARHPEIVRGQRVLEIGSGCGACGILAAKLGAHSVLLTDYVDAVLCNLRACMHLNVDGSNGSCCTGAAGSPTSGSSSTNGAEEGTNRALTADGAGEHEEREQDLTAWDPEDASECGSDDFEAFFAEAASGSPGDRAGRQQDDKQKQAAGAASWDAPPMHVRFYDWQDSVDQLSEAQQAALAGAPGMPPAVHDSPGGSIDSASNDSNVPNLGGDEQYDVIIGTDVLYEWPMVQMVPAVLKHRLRPGGRALLCCAVREQAMFDAAIAGLQALGMRVGVTPVQPQADDAGTMDIHQDYEGGFVLAVVEHADAPAVDWHRDDLFAA